MQHGFNRTTAGWLKTTNWLLKVKLWKESK